MPTKTSSADAEGVVILDVLSVSSAADADLTQPERFPCSSESERVSEKRISSSVLRTDRVRVYLGFSNLVLREQRAFRIESLDTLKDIIC